MNRSEEDNKKGNEKRKKMKKEKEVNILFYFPSAEYVLCYAFFIKICGVVGKPQYNRRGLLI